MKLRCAVLLVLLFLLCGCAASEQLPPESAITTPPHTTPALPELPQIPSVEDEMAKTVNALPDGDFGAEPFLVIYGGESDIFSSDGYNSARRELFDSVAKKYNTDIVGAGMSEQEMYRAISDAVLSDTFFADLVLIPANKLGRYAAAGLLYDVSALPFFDASAEHLDSEAFSVGGYTFAVWGDAIFEPGDIYAVYFDEASALAGGFDLYADAAADNWTLDRFIEVSVALGKTASLLDASHTADAFFFGSGNRLSEYHGGSITLTPPSDQESDLISLLHTLLYGENGVEFSSDGNSAAVYIDSLAHLPATATADRAQGLLPFPSVQGGAQRYTPIAQDALVAAVPINCAYPEKTALVTGALFKLCDGFVYGEYIDYCLHRYLRGYDQLDSLEDIASYPRAWDFSVCFADGVAQLDAVTLRALHNAIENKKTRDIAYYSFADTAYDEIEKSFARYGAIGRGK